MPLPRIAPCEALLQRLAHGEPGFQSLLVGGLCRFPAEAADSWARTAALRESDDQGVLRELVRLGTQVGSDAVASLAVVTHRVRDSDVRVATMDTMGAWRAVASAQAVRSFFSDTSDGVRAAAVVAHLRIADPSDPTPPEVVEAALRERRGAARRAVAVGVVRWAPELAARLLERGVLLGADLVEESPPSDADALAVAEFIRTRPGQFVALRGRILMTWRWEVRTAAVENLRRAALAAVTSAR